MRIGGNSHAYMRHYRFLRDAQIFAGLAGSNEEAESNWRSGEETYRLHAMRVTDNFFGVVGVPLAMGRPIEPGDRDVVVLSDRFWRTRLGAETDVIGRALIIDGRPHTVSGVLPPDHRTVLGFGFSPDVYLPAYKESDIVALIARLPEGMSLQAAYARLAAACRELDKVYPPEWNPKASWVTNTEVVPVAGLARLRNLSMVPFVAFFSMLSDRGRSRAADRLRERLEPAAGPSVGPPPGARDSARPRRGASPDRAPVAGREPAAGPPGRRGRAPAQPVAGRLPQPRGAAAADTRTHPDRAGLATARVCRR